MPRGRPKKILSELTKNKQKKQRKTKVVVPETYDPFLWDHTGVVKANPRNLFEEWGLHNEAKSDSTVDKKLYKKIKKATPRRPPVKMAKVICPICNRTVSILENLVEDFIFTLPNETVLPTFKCDKCNGN